MQQRVKLTTEERFIYEAKKEVARAAVRQAIEKGWLVPPETCEECGGKHERVRIHAAHKSYDAPLTVRWLCAKCHSAWDKLVPYRANLLPERYDHGYSATSLAAAAGRWGVEQGLALRSLRRGTGLNQKEVGDLAGVSQGYISQIESGSQVTPDVVRNVIGTLLEVDTPEARWRGDARADAARARATTTPGVRRRGRPHSREVAQREEEKRQKEQSDGAS